MIKYKDPKKHDLSCDNCSNKPITRLVFENLDGNSKTIKLCATCLYELDDQTRKELEE